MKNRTIRLWEGRCKKLYLCLRVFSINLDKSETVYNPDSSKCITCNTELQGDYCYKCGEKKIIPSKDYSIKEFIEEAAEGLIHLDSKFIKTFWLLIRKPGFLVAEYNRGHRKPYMKPIQVFVVATVLFYFIYPPSYLFFSAIENINNGYHGNAIGTNVFHYDVGGKIKQFAIQKNLTINQAIEEVEKEASHKSKEFLFIILPFLALMTYALFRKANSYFIPHLILWVYLLSFFIIANLLIISVIFWVFHLKDVDDTYFESIAVVFIAYMFLSVKKVYKRSWFQTFWKSAIMLLWFIILVLFYRQVITVWAVISL